MFIAQEISQYWGFKEIPYVKKNDFLLFVCIKMFRQKKSHPPLSSSNRLPNWKEFPIHYHPTCKAEVQDVRCHYLTRHGKTGQGKALPR